MTLKDRFINKSFITNLLAALVAILGYYLQNPHLLPIGFYALSGALTNWLAVFMLFEKVPLLYGSGVIPNRFKEFKVGIKNLIMSQFFTETNITRFFQDSTDSTISHIDLNPILDGLDYEHIFQGLVTAIMESSFGSMLSMVGGAAALEPLKEPMTLKIRSMLLSISETEHFNKALADQISFFHPEKVIEKVEQIVEQRLEELTPQMVKMIIQNMIRQHLGWLVVWGGIFGGLIGFVVSFIPN